MNKAKIYPWIFAVILILIVTVNSGVASGDDYKLLWSYDIRTDCGSVVSLSPDGNYIAAGGCVVKYQSVWYGFYFFNKEGELLYESKSINDEPYDISISSNGGYVAILCHDGSDCDSDIYLFNKEGKVIWEYSIDDGEDIVTPIANAFYAFIIDNPEFIKLILKYAEELRK